MPLRTLIYVSRLSEQHQDGVGAILRQARAAIAIHGETGVLLFDGEAFAQLLEGEEDELRQLLVNLVHDPRHVGVRVVCNLPIAARRYPTFRMSYASTEDMDAVARLAELGGQRALDRFHDMVQTSDVEA